MTGVAYTHIESLLKSGKFENELNDTKIANLMGLERQCCRYRKIFMLKMRLSLQNLASIQPRADLPKFGFPA